MTTTPNDFWAALEAAMRRSLPDRTRVLIALQGYDDRWISSEPDARAGLIEEAARLAVDAMAAYEGADRRKVSSPRTSKVSGDERWPLWRELMQMRRAAESDSPGPPWEPLRFFVVRDSSALPVRNKRVEISFDWRLPRAALEYELARAWRHMARNGWVRQGRPFGRHLADIVRFNCLVVAPGTPWRERMERWNAQSAQDDAYDDVRKFERAFRRAEEQLTGQKWGLAWFYDDLVRSGRLARLNTPEGRDLLKKGSKRLVEMYRELYDPSFMQPPEWFAQVYREAEDEEQRPGYRPIHWARGIEGWGVRSEQDWGEGES